MIQEVRQDEPQYICVIPVASITGNQDEEIMTFGVSADEAKNQALQLLVDKYGCSELQVTALVQEARIETINQWCSPKQSQD